jgi:hypothetical protein
MIDIALAIAIANEQPRIVIRTHASIAYKFDERFRIEKSIDERRVILNDLSNKQPLGLENFHQFIDSLFSK